ncbi:LeuA family protein [Desulfovibrio psychrotolerans]|uniref:Homocitrate synthase n=1 Tax=Desulfovibrio psychrotolerans TaxID=415242 RepID=A0A7J0BR04_9BACT|nr:hypothetical protein [Desulfovibrio psychrotolerans]GFM36100.1 homocitrate synthase [Desulfovibrio psychrotolerans]
MSPDAGGTMRTEIFRQTERLPATPPALLDTTLREGEQSFGVYLDMNAKRHIIKTLYAAGIEEMELGYAGQESLPQLLQHTRRAAPNMPCTVWCRCREEDIHAVAALGVTRISIGVPVSHAHIVTRLRTTEEALLARLESVLRLARTCGIGFVSLGLEDCSRAAPQTALRMALHGVTHGAARIRLSDTVGILTPMQTAELVRFFRRHLPAHVRLATHFHNDFGMATANAITALASGADSTDVSILGLGERAGIARLEEVAAARVLTGEAHNAAGTQGAHSRSDASPQYNLAALRTLAHTVAGLTSMPLARNLPVIGADIFSVESGIHADGMHKSPELFEPYAPELVQGSRSIRLGRKSGAAAVAHAARNAGWCLSRHAVNELVARVRALSDRCNRALTDAEFRNLCHQVHTQAPDNANTAPHRAH